MAMALSEKGKQKLTLAFASLGEKYLTGDKRLLSMALLPSYKPNTATISTPAEYIELPLIDVAAEIYVSEQLFLHNWEVSPLERYVVPNLAEKFFSGRDQMFVNLLSSAVDLCNPNQTLPLKDESILFSTNVITNLLLTTLVDTPKCVPARMILIHPEIAKRITWPLRTDPQVSLITSKVVPENKIFFLPEGPIGRLLVGGLNFSCETLPREYRFTATQKIGMMIPDPNVIRQVTFPEDNLLSRITFEISSGRKT